MAATDRERLALYNGLQELLGTERADTLMAYLPEQPANRLAHKEDLDRFELRFNARMEGLEARMGGFEDRMDRFEDRMDRFEDRMDRFDGSLQAINHRLDRLFLTLVAGMVGVLGAVAAAFLTA